MLYQLLSRIVPTQTRPPAPQRIVFIRPCCIGDVVMATGALVALRETFPEAHITWAVGAWSAQAIQHHPAINAILDTGNADLPIRSVRDFLQFVRQLRTGQFDLAVSLVRSPLMSLAVALAGIPYRVGLDSNGRGFGYNMRVTIDPSHTEHEGDIYLKVISQLAGHPVHAYANLPILDTTRASLESKLSIAPPYIVVHPGGGSNPGMQLDAKRYPIDALAQIVNCISTDFAARVVVVGGSADHALVDALIEKLADDTISIAGALSLAEIGALAANALLYIGNDTGLTHLASASGAHTVMMMGPTDPQRYAPFTEHHLVLWKPKDIRAGGVATADPSDWDWARDGFSVDFAIGKIREFLS